MTHDEANEILNRFAGPKAWYNIPPFDYFADTVEAREAVRLLKDEFVRRTKDAIKVETYISFYEKVFKARATFIDCNPEHDTNDETDPYVDSDIESHAIALAIAAALKEQAKK